MKIGNFVARQMCWYLVGGTFMGTRFVVLKYGGTSVASAQRWESILDVAQSRIDEGYVPVLVCSALAGVSNLLDRLLTAAMTDTHHGIIADIEARHRGLAMDLGVSGAWLDDALLPLKRLADGAALIKEATPRMKAAAMAMGELLSTRLGALFLQSRGLEAQWIDARDHMRALPTTGDAAWLSVHCDDSANQETQNLFSQYPCVITQGFIGRNDDGDTVLLGRGGSDTSAALFAAKIGAERCEIWTDVPGVYTANPRDIPEARMLKLLDYEEAQEIASAGASVLHPRCLGPVSRHGIPLHVRCTHRPELTGTIIGPNAPDTAEVKVISTRSDITLISMNALGMWQRVGFLADVFICFKNHGVSVDLVSTSETNVTASFDSSAGVVPETTVAALLRDLSMHCEPRLIRDCASVSLVGRHIRAILHQLGPALEVFESQKIHLLSQAASDLNLTFVVDGTQADRLVRKLHALLFNDERASTHLGPTWRDTFETKIAQPVRVPQWWEMEKRALLKLSAQTPAYVYHGPTIDRAANSLLGLEAVDRVFYAVKANDNAQVLKRLRALGIRFECVSSGELAHVRSHCPDILGEDILFTPNFAPQAEYEEAFELGAFVTVDALHPLLAWPETFRDREILLRLDPGRGRGHHAYVRTAGAQSKFGIGPDEIATVADAAERAGARVIGLHAHAGSGIRSPEAWNQTAHFLMAAADRFPDARILDLGGGLGVVERPGLAPLDMNRLSTLLARFKALHPDFELWLEPGRFLVAEAGALIMSVTQTKSKGEINYVGVDAGMNTFLRPALYGSWHEIVNLSRVGKVACTEYNVVGPICETGDTLGYGRKLPRTQAGDVLLLATAGAYGSTMSSDYNRRPRAIEVMLDPK
jgi:diaminopimelate decarboxylase/aspartate kinase